jgi:phospho-N-acetylmuramoyl-pentapeptide-transferase
MLYTFLYNYMPGAPFLNVLRYPSFRIVMAAFTALVLTLFLYPPFIRRLQIFKYGQEVRKDGPEAHLKKQGTPTMGGILILGSVFFSTVLWADISNIAVWLLLLVTMGYGAVGFYDDYKKIKHRDPAGLAGRWKLFWQFSIGAVALGVWAWGKGTIAFDTHLSLPFVPLKVFPVIPPIVYLPLALTLLVVGTSNAVNLTDGLDGLAIGPVIVASFVFLVLGYAAGTTIKGLDLASYLHIVPVKGSVELCIFCSAVCGAGIGFLWYNAYPALVFMGDVGALALGGALGMLAIFTKNELLSALLHGVFLAETLSVMIQSVYFKYTKKRYGEGRRIFKMAPVHHHFEKAGWPEPRVVIRFWIVSVMLALIALASLKLR